MGLKQVQLPESVMHTLQKLDNAEWADFAVLNIATGPEIGVALKQKTGGQLPSY